MKIIMLGCGNSSGVPLIGCNCEVCRSDNPKNKRLRVSAYVETEGVKFLIDTSPDLRQQALSNNITQLDAILYTHEHADHIHGLDDLRPFNYLRDGSLPVYGDEHTIASVKQRFAYAFLPKPENIWFRPSLIPHTLPAQAAGHIDVRGVKVAYFQQGHGKSTTLGYRISDFAYSTDTDRLPESAFAALAGTKTWIVDCLRYQKSHSHSTLTQTLEWIARVKPELAILTHMGHELEYEKLARELPGGVVPGYDGLTVEI
jgi:phosphoribosyl 1,2-cyclic phosphate phosphodiesterase